MPKIFVTVKPSAKKEEVLKVDETHYKVSVKAAPDEGKANKALVEALHRFFGIPKSSFSIISGQTSRNKVVLIL